MAAVLFGLALVASSGCKTDGDNGSDTGSGTGTGSDTGSTTGASSDGGADDGSDTGGDDGGTSTGEDTDTTEGTGETGTESTTETSGESGSTEDTNGGPCAEYDKPQGCNQTQLCVWEGDQQVGECVPWSGDCEDITNHQACEAKMGCAWTDSACGPG